MSGHSHWHSIRHQKEAADKKRGAVFSKLSRAIIMASRAGGGDPDTNYRLRLAIEKAKEFDMPKDNIERAIKKGSGEEEADALEEVSVEAYGPGGVSLIIEGITDNKNRTLGEIKATLAKYKGKMVTEGAVRWSFDRKGVLTIEPAGEREEAELKAIEAGAEDLRWKDSLLVIHTVPEDLERTKQALSERGLEVKESSLEWIPKEEMDVSQKERELCEKLFEALDENDAVQEIFSNLKTSS